MITVKTYTEPPFNTKEILRYANCKSTDIDILELMDECIDLSRSVLTYKVCYLTCDISDIPWKSDTLVKTLDGCKNAIVFGATIGIPFDRLLTKYSRLSPSRALMLQAIGAERIETLCNTFCNDLNITRPRVSAGYGDFPLETQKDIFAMLELTKRIGVSLNDSMIMSPSKSVTAVAGLE